MKKFNETDGTLKELNYQLHQLIFPSSMPFDFYSNKINNYLCMLSNLSNRHDIMLKKKSPKNTRLDFVE